MTDKLAQLLLAVVSSSQNQYFKDIAELVYRTCKGGRVYKGEEVLRFVSQPHERSHIPEAVAEHRDTFLDRRITDLCVKNFRAFFHTDDDKMLGIKLHRNDNPRSLFLVGSNGSGKSSLFTALETLYSCHITTKILMKIADDDNYEIHDFGKYGQVDKATVKISARFADNSVINRSLIDDAISPICPPSAFCSDYDVEQVAHHKLDLTPFVLSQNGYGNIYDFHSHVLSEWINELNKLQINRQPELQKLREIGMSKKELLTAYSTLLSLTQGVLQNVDFGYYIQVCDNIFEVISTFQELLISINREDSNNALPELMSAINRLVLEFRNIRMGQENKEVFFTILQEWEDLMKSLETEEQRLTDDILTLADDILKANGHLPHEFDVKKKASSLKSVLRAVQKDYQMFKDDVTAWPQVQDTYIKKLAILQADEDAEIKVNNYISLVQDLQKAVSHFRQRLTEEIDRIVDTFIETQGQYIDEALAWFAAPGEKFHFHKDETTGFPVVTISYNRGQTTIDTYPSLYLNTFRFRLFVITLKIALAFSFMQQEKVLIPIVIDEVFNSSDFENRLRLEEFIQIIYAIYDDMHISSSRLQLILFTHDEVVLRSFVRGASMRKKYDFNEHVLKDYEQARLFSQSDASKLNKLYEKMGEMEYLNLYKIIS